MFIYFDDYSCTYFVQIVARLDGSNILFYGWSTEQYHLSLSECGFLQSYQGGMSSVFHQSVEDGEMLPAVSLCGDMWNLYQWRNLLVTESSIFLQRSASRLVDVRRSEF